MRLDLFLAGHFSRFNNVRERLSRAEIQRLINEGRITINNKKAKASTRIRRQDRIDISLPPPRDAEIASEALPLDILYEDRDCIVLNKAAGMTVHPAAGHWSGTLVNALLHHCPDIQGIGGVRRPGIVHRLDKETSGVMIVAKNMVAYHNLVEQFKNRSIKKEYLALAWGNVTPDKGVIDRPVGRHRSDRKRMSSRYFSGTSREALTEWKVEERFVSGRKELAQSFVTLLRLWPHTGRTHQIRVHLADTGHPLVGDRIYGKNRKGAEKNSFDDPVVESFSRHALHAEKLTLTHVHTGQSLQFVAPLPKDLTELLFHLRMLKHARTRFHL
jgi:23S rRNA pseudouridine1911/1915/1917 synthase